MGHLNSFREYIEALRGLGELQEIDAPVDWNLEIGGIIKRSYDLRAPAPLFNCIKGCATGMRVLGAPAGLSCQPGLTFARIALSLGMSPESTATQLVETLARARQRKGLTPVTVTEAPCQENVFLQGDVDLTMFPVPWIHRGDGGRYINTFGVVIVQTPDKKWTNWSVNRVMLTGKNTMTGTGFAAQHLGMIYNRWKATGHPMPFAVAMGVPPVVPFVGGMPLSENVSEPDFIGGFLGKPLSVVPCRTVDLLVPATAEIVIEGTVGLEETAAEGPMGEYTGYLCSEQPAPQPVYRVSAVTHRNRPILPVVAAGEPAEENHTCWGIAVAAEALSCLQESGFPVSRCFIPFESAMHWLVVTVDGSYRGKVTAKELVHRLAEIVFANKAGLMLSKIFLVDDDIDPSNINEVVWAFASRAHPRHGQFLFPDQPPFPLQLFVTPEEKATRKSTKVIYSCLYPDTWHNEHIPRRLTLQETSGEPMASRILARWHEYGYR